MPTHNVTIDPTVNQKVPSLFVETLEVDDVTVTRSPENIIQEQRRFLEAWKNKTIEDLESQPLFKAYRVIHEQFNAYPSDIPPAVENLYTRGILKGRFPSINNIVDTCNLVSVKNLIPIGVFDSDAIKGDVTLRLAVKGDTFIPIGKTSASRIEPKVPILEDSERIISSIGVRDANETKITRNTENLTLFSWGNNMVPRDLVQETLDEAAQAIKS
jgi:DNA/RNA-binding domain of Phe-tRNA-synthetase-like protein